ncbi:MAG: SEL1-like repeat protein [Deltaproteobacteria bacterium]|nr:SEL1-like repeat protein [Deltaproteobacteria bacterium]
MRGVVILGLGLLVACKREPQRAPAPSKPELPAELRIPDPPKPSTRRGGWVGIKLGEPKSDGSAIVGVPITAMYAGSPAAQADLRVGDVLSAIGGRVVRSTIEIHQLLREHPSGSAVRLGILRGNSPLDVELTLGGPLEAFAAYSGGCERGSAGECNDLAALLAEGTLGSVESAKATTLFERACASGAVHACYNLGLNLLDGSGTEKDATRARQLFRQACEGEIALSCQRLAMELGLGPDTRPLLERACKGKVGSACTQLGVSWATSGDREKAAGAFLDGCAALDGTGCLNAGLAMKHAIGAAYDPERAKALYQKACELGEYRACER